MHLGNLIILWPIIGWLCGYFSIPERQRPLDIMTWILLFVIGAFVGPFGVFWFWLNKDL
jgi:hypothetical protein